MEILLIVFAVIVVLFLAFACANAFYKIACMKGHDDKQYFWWTFFIPLIGALMVIALPDRKEVEDKSPVITPANTNGQKTHVDVVAAPRSATIAADMSEAAPVVTPRATEGQIECPVCGKLQRANRTVCWECGTKFNKG